MDENQNATLEYFKEKFNLWNSESGSLRKYIPLIGGKKKIIKELDKDAEILKNTVCPYIKRVGYLQAKSTLLQAAEGLTGNELNFPVVGVIDLVLGSLLDACGYVKRGDSLLEADL
ncbi:MAG: hypothetical protein ACYCT2_06175 [Thermoplasmataceae archaeon]